MYELDRVLFFRPSEKYFGSSKGRIGGQYKKARFHQYTDSTFTNETQRQPSENHLGILGPVIRAEVGDKIHVSLLNKLSHPVSLYLEGSTLNKSQDGLWLKEQGSKISYGPRHEKLSSRVCKQHRRRRACASAQSDQRLYYSLYEKYHM